MIIIFKYGVDGINFISEHTLFNERDLFIYSKYLNILQQSIRLLEVSTLNYFFLRYFDGK